MKKLIELLNKYEAKLEDMPLTRHRWRSYNGELCRRFMVNKDAERMIISKSFGFIKWLVDNDKIELKAGPLYGFQPIMNNRQPFTLYETLLMLLSISDTPIEDLVSYLK